MQIRLKIALAAASFALATIPVFAVEMPTDGSKNFSTPNDAPSYFANETVPESARVDHATPFTSEDGSRPGRCAGGFRRDGGRTARKARLGPSIYEALAGQIERPWRLDALHESDLVEGDENPGATLHGNPHQRRE